jgi:hypothetical protein
MTVKRVPKVIWRYWGIYEFMEKYGNFYGMDQNRSDCHYELCEHYGLSKDATKSITDNMHTLIDAEDLHIQLNKLKKQHNKE